MKNNFPATIASLCLALFLFGCDTHAPKPTSTDPGVPDALKVDLSKEKLAFSLKASGVQIYQCVPDTTDPERKNKWLLKAPEAELFDDKGQLVGSHGKGPSWKSVLKNDTSSVLGILPGGKPKGRADSPSKGAIPWLLIEAQGAGEGMFGKVTKIQRVETNGGKAPEGCCDASGCCTEIRVPYTAIYYFYAPK